MNVNGNIEERKVQHYAPSHSENDQDDDDEFFGNQSDSYSDYEHEREHENEHGHGSLEKHEEQAQRETHKNIGYHEAYDEYKEIKLQQGFEDGYRGTIDDAMKLGMLLGKCVAASVFHVENEDMVKNEDADEDEDSGVEYDEADVGYLETVGIVRRYLEKAQSTTDENIQNITTSTSTTTNTSTTVSDHENNEIRTIMERLEERLRI